MLKKYNIEYFIICGPLTKFLLIKLILWPAQQFEFDMPFLNDSSEINAVKVYERHDLQTKKIFKKLKASVTTIFFVNFVLSNIIENALNIQIKIK